MHCYNLLPQLTFYIVVKLREQSWFSLPVTWLKSGICSSATVRVVGIAECEGSCGVSKGGKKWWAKYVKKCSFNILLLAALAFWLLLFRLRTFSLFIVLQVLLKDFFKVGRFPRPNRKLRIISSPASGSIHGLWWTKGSAWHFYRMCFLFAQRF